MTGGRSHDPVTVATAQARPGLPCWHRSFRANTRPRVRLFDHGIKPGGSWPGSQVPFGP